jgi:Flp pilus assembly protein TadG
MCSLPVAVEAAPRENLPAVIGNPESLMQSNETNQPGSRRRKQRGADLIEFTMILLPLLMILFALVDTSYGIFVKATLQAAAHAGLRYGVTITGTQANAAGSNLTTMVKGYVQSQSLGFLSGSNGLNYIHVNFYALVGTPSVVTNVNGTTNENVSPNLMQVSVDQYPLPALVPRLFSWATPADKSATTISAVSVDEIEPSSDVPTPGPTP